MADAITDQNAMMQRNAGTDVQKAPVKNPIDTFMQSHTVLHFGRLLGLAAAVAIGTVVVLWSSEPNYAPLYTNVSGRDAGEIANILNANDIEYKIDAASGTILVAQTQAAEARLKLAAQGLPESSSKGLEMLQDEQGLGTSQFIEKARYNHALEAELARSVESIRSVEQARIHLAMPKQSIFIRNRTKPSASVMTKLYAGRKLTPGQVDAIVHMVAASVPMLESEQVTVVDQFGRLLTADKDNEMAQTNKQFEYTRKLENSYSDRIINLLQPIVGEGRVNAQVSASLDFSNVESTREAYDPERSVIRSEQVTEQETRDLNQALGIPGALSNQPPGAGTTNPEQVDANAATALPANQNRSATRNFEVDRMISHTQNQRGTVQRLSVAVVIDLKKQLKDDGTIERIAYNEEEIQRFETLVRETIGFQQNRGDSVSIINSDFITEELEVIEVPLWKSLMGEAWVWDLAKQVLGAIGLLIVYLMFGRPFLRSLKPGNAQLKDQRIDPETGELIEDDEDGEGGSQAGATRRKKNELAELTEDPNSMMALIRRGDATHDQKIEMARAIVMDDPARVANVMKHWINEE